MFSASFLGERTVTSSTDEFSPHVRFLFLGGCNGHLFNFFLAAHRELMLALRLWVARFESSSNLIFRVLLDLSLVQHNTQTLFSYCVLLFKVVTGREQQQLFELYNTFGLRISGAMRERCWFHRINSLLLPAAAQDFPDHSATPSPSGSTKTL